MGGGWQVMRESTMQVALQVATSGWEFSGGKTKVFLGRGHGGVLEGMRMQEKVSPEGARDRSLPGSWIRSG